MSNDAHTVDVISPDGEVGSIPASQLEQAGAQGYSPAAPADVIAARERALLETPQGIAATAALGAGRGLFLGLPIADAAFAAGYGGDGAEAKKTIKGLQEANPGTFTAGEVAGSVLLPGGGGSGLARAAQRGAAEGALYGAGGAVSDSYLSGSALTGEKLAAAALAGGGIGAGAAGAFGLGARGVGGLFRGGKRLAQRALARPGEEALQRAGGDLLGSAAPGLGKALDALDAASSSLSGASRGSLSAMFKRGRSGKLGFEVATNADDVLARVGDDTLARLERIQDAREAVGRRFRGDLKADQMSGLISRGDDVAARQVDASRLTLETVRKDIESMLEREADFSGRGFLKKTRKRLASLESKIDAAVEAGDPDAGLKSFMWLDSFKRDIGKRATKMTRRVGRGGTADDAATAAWFDGTYEKVRGVLEDGDTWGGAAKAQKAINKEWSRTIDGQRSFDRLFTKREVGRFGATRRVIDREGVGAFVKSLRNPDKAPEFDALSRHLDEVLDFTETAQRHMQLPAAEARQVSRLANEVSGLRRALGDGKEAIALQNQLRELSGDSGGGLLGGALGGGILGGPAGAALGTAASSLIRPGNTVKRIAAVYRIAGGIDKQKLAAIGKISRAAKRASKAAQGKAPRGVAAAWSSEYDRRSRETRLAEERPALVRQEIQRTLAPLAESQESGAAVEAAAGVYMRQQEFLAQLLPPLDTRGVLAKRGRPDAGQAFAFIEASKVLDNPARLMSAAADGTVTSGQIRAVGAVYPELLKELRSDVAQELMRLEESGRELPYPRRVALGTMLDAPTDPLLQPQMMALLQGSFSSPEPERQGGGAPVHSPNIANAYRTGSEEDPRI